MKMELLGSFSDAKNLLEITENKKIDTLSEKVDIL